MKSYKNIINVLLQSIKHSYSTVMIKARSTKITLPEPTVLLKRVTTSKSRLLKAKYSQSRLRLNRHKKGIYSFLSIHGLTQKISRIRSSLKLKPAIKFKPSFNAKPSFQFLHNLSFAKIKAHITIPKFSLSQLSFPVQIPKLNLKVALTAFMILSIGSASSIGWAKVNKPVDAFAVEVNGKQVSVVASVTDAEELYRDMKAEKAREWNREVRVKETLAFKTTQVKEYQLDSLDALEDKLNDNLSFEAVSTGIMVNGQVAVVVKDEAAAKEVLQKLKDSFTTGEMQVVSVNFQEQIELAQVPVSLKEVLDADKALELLKEGRQKKLTHKVAEGDSLWQIARDNDMHVEELLKMNPDIKGEHLDLGQELTLVASEPIINVLVSGKQTVKETVPYKVVVQSDKSTWQGTQKVKTKGQNGMREVDYQIAFKNGSIVSKEVLQEKVLKAAVDQVVVKGSRVIVASRSGSGIVSWPIRGRINSPFGRRWGSMHTGIDIDGNTGQPVGAADDGVVVSAAREGNYGNMITIRHSNGLVTRYAHLSKFKVSAGQRVEKGDLIGLVGSTGRSTGPHLHFEVLRNGSFQNPLKLLK